MNVWKIVRMDFIHLIMPLLAPKFVYLAMENVLNVQDQGMRDFVRLAIVHFYFLRVKIV
jgi:hypothetical protein